MSATSQAQPEAATPQWLLPALSFASSMYVYVLVALALIAAGATFAAGLRPHVISTGSMSPAVKPGDIVLTNDAIDRAQLGQGTVITFEHPEHARFLVTHRIAGLNDDGTYQTKGDANRVADPYAVSQESIVGAGQLVVPLIGLPATWLRRGMWLEFGLFLLASTIAFAGATLKLDEDDDEPEVDERVSRGADIVPLHRRVGSWAAEQVAAITALATVVLTAGAVALYRRSGALITDRVLDVVQAGGGAPVPLWRSVALAAVAGTGFVVVKVALQGGRWELAARQYGVPRPLTSRLAWFERNGSIFVGVLAMFVLTGAGTALAQTAAGAFTDSVDGGTSTATAATIDPPSGVSALASCADSTAEVAVGWTASPDTEATGYEILRSTTSGGSYSSVGTVSDPAATAFTDTGLSYSTTYYYVVRTTTSTSWVSPWTSEVSATTADCSPPDMWISSLTGASSSKDATNWTATVTAEVSTDAGLLSGATVSGSWDDLTGTLLGTSSCTTDASGTCSVSMDPLITTSEVTFTVTDVSEAGHEYVSSRNAISSVAVNAP